MACSDKELIIYVDGVPLTGRRRDTGCSGDKHTFTTSTTLEGTVEYLWSLDGISPPKPLLGSGPSYTYTFDDKKHKLYLVARSLDCGIQLTVEVEGKACVPCPTAECVTSTATVPVGILYSLIDSKGKVYPIDGNPEIECVTNSALNKIAAKSIVRTIRAASKCNLKTLNASVYNNQPAPNCLTITISNSPINFKYVKVGYIKYPLDTSKC